MSKRMLALATSIMMAAPLLAVPGFAQTPAAPAAPAPAPATQAPAVPATPAPAAPSTSAPSTSAPSTSAPAASGSMSMPMHHAGAAHAGMHPGAHMDRVKKLQTALNSNGATLTVDGKMGPKTTDALKTFQQSHNLKVTGRPDKATRDALMKPAS